MTAAAVRGPVVARPVPAAGQPVSTAPQPVSVAAPMLGGRVSIHVIDDRPADDLSAEADRVLRRIEAWAGRLTRFSSASELSRLNAASAASVAVGPTLTAVLDWARTAESRTDGLVSVAFLDARLAAESGISPLSPPAGRRWSLDRQARGAAVRRPPGLRFDLDGIAKGWLADRALTLLAARSALVDGDGDLAIRVAPGDAWSIGVADPRPGGETLAALRLAGTDRPRCFGLATSGTSVHRWLHPGGATHHLIDPRTGRPAVTDLVQATVLAVTARDAEAFAKLVLIGGSADAPRALDRPGVLGALLLTEAGELQATPGMLRWLA